MFCFNKNYFLGIMDIIQSSVARNIYKGGQNRFTVVSTQKNRVCS